DQTAPCRKIFGAPEIDRVIFQRLPLRHQPVALRFLDRLVQFKTLAALGAQEQGAGLGDRSLEVFLGAGLDVDLGDFGDHGGYGLWLGTIVSIPPAGKKKRRAAPAM